MFGVPKLEPVARLHINCVFIVVVVFQPIIDAELHSVDGLGLPAHLKQLLVQSIGFGVDLPFLPVLILFQLVAEAHVLVFLELQHELAEVVGTEG